MNTRLWSARRFVRYRYEQSTVSSNSSSSQRSTHTKGRKTRTLPRGAPLRWSRKESFLPFHSPGNRLSTHNTQRSARTLIKGRRKQSTISSNSPSSQRSTRIRRRRSTTPSGRTVRRWKTKESNIPFHPSGS